MASIQFKRGKLEVWEQLDPILEAGQPGYVTDADDHLPRLKIGDGVSRWSELPYEGETSIINKNTYYDFPSVGRPNVIYKAEKEKMLYQWNSSQLKYEKLSLSGPESDIVEIKVIHGGKASI